MTDQGRRYQSREAPDLNQLGAVLAPVKAAARRLRRWPAASLDQRSARHRMMLQAGAEKRHSNRTEKRYIKEALGSWMNRQIAVYVFRDGHVAPRRDTVVSVAARDAVAAVYGGGGVMDGDGLSRAFGGNCAFRDDDTGTCFIGVWGARNASRFRNGLRHGGCTLEVVHARPPARLVVWTTTGLRPARH